MKKDFSYTAEPAKKKKKTTFGILPGSQEDAQAALRQAGTVVAASNLSSMKPETKADVLARLKRWKFNEPAQEKMRLEAIRKLDD